MIRRLLRDQRGNVLALSAIALPLVIGCAALAVDATQWVLGKRQLQAAVDAAAVAGVYGLIQGTDPEDAVNDTLSRRPDLHTTGAIQVERSPSTRPNDPHAVRVRLAAPAPLTFASLFVQNPPTVSAEAVATLVENGEFCAFALGSKSSTGIIVEPNSTLRLDCGIAANASSDRAIVAHGSSSMEASSIIAFGGIESGEEIRSEKIRAYALRQKDPLADTEPPLVPDTGCPNVTVNPDAASFAGGRVVLKPGCYGNVVLNGPVFLESGEYILHRGSLLIGPTAEVTCRACTIFLTSREAATDPASVGKLRIHHHAKVKLSAPTQGPNAGILIYQDRHAALDRDGFENVVAGNSFSRLRGLLYFPSETLRVDGSMGPDLQCVRIVGQRLVIEGRLVIAKDCAADGIVNFAGTEVRLVG